jgi:hypothetical protein
LSTTTSQDTSATTSRTSAEAQRSLCDIAAAKLTFLRYAFCADEAQRKRFIAVSPFNEKDAQTYLTNGAILNKSSKQLAEFFNISEPMAADMLTTAEKNATGLVDVNAKTILAKFAENHDKQNAALGRFMDILVDVLKNAPKKSAPASDKEEMTLQRPLENRKGISLIDFLNDIMGKGCTIEKMEIVSVEKERVH